MSWGLCIPLLLIVLRVHDIYGRFTLIFRAHNNCYYYFLVHLLFKLHSKQSQGQRKHDEHRLCFRRIRRIGFFQWTQQGKGDTTTSKITCVSDQAKNGAILLLEMHSEPKMPLHYVFRLRVLFSSYIYLSWPVCA